MSTDQRSGRERAERVREWVGTSYGRVAAVGRGLVHPPSQRLVVVEAPARDGLLRLPAGRFTGLDTIAVQLLRGTYEPTTRAVLAALVRPGSTFVDIGANIGYFTVLGGLLVGDGGRVLALEPEPSNARLLHTNVTRNGLDQVVEVVEAAVAAEPGESVLNVNASESGWHRLEPGARPDEHHVPVAVRRLDDELAARHLVADVIKIDVEGHEAGAIAGFGRALTDNPDVAVVIEHSPSQATLCGYPPMAALDALWDAGLEHTYLIDEQRGRVEPVQRRDLLSTGVTSRSENLVLSRRPVSLP